MWWVPLAAAGIATAVNVLLAFGGYLGRREGTSQQLSSQLAADEARSGEREKNAAETLRRLEAELERIRVRLHDLADRKMGDFVIKITMLEKDVARLEERVDAIARAMGEAT